MPGCDLLSTDPSREGETSEADRDAKESPMLTDRVKAGELPPLAERLPDNPLVVEVLTEPGRYGGTLRNTAPVPGALMRSPVLPRSVRADAGARRVLRVRH